MSIADEAGDIASSFRLVKCHVCRFLAGRDDADEWEAAAVEHTGRVMEALAARHGADVSGESWVRHRKTCMQRRGTRGEAEGER